MGTTRTPTVAMGRASVIVDILANTASMMPVSDSGRDRTDTFMHENEW